jgi:broad specificity phosphatase PhoE
VRRLLLVRHAPTAATRAAAFPADEPLDERGRGAAASLADRLPARCEVLCSPAARCVQTATAAGLTPLRSERLLAECDFGAWAGCCLAEVEARAAGAWMTDPSATPHGGESLRAFAARVAGWLDMQARLDGRAVAITHGGVVKAAVVHALGAPLDAFWRIDCAPLSITELHAHDGRWTVTRVNALADSPRHPGSTCQTRAAAGAAGAVGSQTRDAAGAAGPQAREAAGAPG